MEEQWEVQQKTGLGTERDADLMRETLLETSPWLLGVTFVVSLLHMLFDFLAFKNDIQVQCHCLIVYLFLTINNLLFRFISFCVIVIVLA